MPKDKLGMRWAQLRVLVVASLVGVGPRGSKASCPGAVLQRRGHRGEALTMLPGVVLFDLDGTLSDSAPGILAALRHAFAVNGLAPLDAAYRAGAARTAVLRVTAAAHRCRRPARGHHLLPGALRRREACTTPPCIPASRGCSPHSATRVSDWRWPRASRNISPCRSPSTSVSRTISRQCAATNSTVRCLPRRW